jgi:hypothetical protein
MHQQDYIMRIIELAGRFLAELRRTIVEGGLDDLPGDDDIVQISRRAGLDLELLRSVDLQTMVLLLSPSGEIETARIWLAGELFAVEAERLQRLGRIDGAIDAYRRALCLYAHVDGSLVLKGLPEASARRRELEMELQHLTGPTPPGAA